MSARDRILGRVRAALGRNAPLPESALGEVRAKLEKHPAGPVPAMSWDPFTQFRTRCLALSSTVDEIGGLADVPAALARYVSDNGLTRTGVCWPEYESLPWGAAGLAFESRPARGDDLIGVTGVYCALAETGTLMLLSSPTTHAATSLLPETHVALVPASRIVRCMEDAWTLLRRERGTLPRQVAFVSGPSRTADIEMTLVLGIHGPYRVHIIILQDL